MNTRIIFDLDFPLSFSYHFDIGSLEKDNYIFLLKNIYNPITTQIDHQLYFQVEYQLEQYLKNENFKP